MNPLILNEAIKTRKAQPKKRKPVTIRIEASDGKTIRIDAFEGDDYQKLAEDADREYTNFLTRQSTGYAKSTGDRFLPEGKQVGDPAPKPFESKKQPAKQPAKPPAQSRLQQAGQAIGEKLQSTGVVAEPVDPNARGVGRRPDEDIYAFARTKLARDLAAYEKKNGKVPDSELITVTLNVPELGKRTLRLPLWQAQELEMFAGRAISTSNEKSLRRAAEIGQRVNEQGAAIHAGMTDSPLANAIAAVEMGTIGRIPGYKGTVGDKGFTGHLAGLIAGTLNIPSEVVAETAMLVSPGASRDQATRALANLVLNVANPGVVGAAAIKGLKGAKAARAVAKAIEEGSQITPPAPAPKPRTKPATTPEMRTVPQTQMPGFATPATPRRSVLDAPPRQEIPSRVLGEDVTPPATTGSVPDAPANAHVRPVEPTSPTGAAVEPTPQTVTPGESDIYARTKAALIARDNGDFGPSSNVPYREADDALHAILHGVSYGNPDMRVVIGFTKAMRDVPSDKGGNLRQLVQDSLRSRPGREASTGGTLEHLIDAVERGKISAKDAHDWLMASTTGDFGGVDLQTAARDILKEYGDVEIVRAGANAGDRGISNAPMLGDEGLLRQGGGLEQNRVVMGEDQPGRSGDDVQPGERNDGARQRQPDVGMAPSRTEPGVAGVTPDVPPVKESLTPQPAAPVVAESATPPATPTSARQADINRMAEDLGKSGYSTDEVRTWQSLAENADPSDVPMTAGAWTDQQTVNATVRLNQLDAERKAAKQAGDVDALATIEDEMESLLGKMYEAGTEQGRALAARKFGPDLDYSAPAMKARYRQRAEQRGVVPKLEDIKRLDDLAKKLEDAEAKIKELEGRGPAIAQGVSVKDEARIIAKDPTVLSPNDPRLDPLDYDPMTDSGGVYDPELVNELHARFFGDLDGTPETRAEAVRQRIRDAHEEAARKAVDEERALRWREWATLAREAGGADDSTGWHVARKNADGQWVASSPAKMVGFEGWSEDAIAAFMDWFDQRPISGAGAEYYVRRGRIKDINASGSNGLVMQPEELLQFQGDVSRGMVPASIMQDFQAYAAGKAADAEGKAIRGTKKVARTKSELDAELQGLLREFNEARGGGPAGMGNKRRGAVRNPLPPDAMAALGKIAANRIKYGVATVDEWIEAVQAVFRAQQLPEPTREDILTAYAEHKAATKKTVSEDVAEARRVRAQLERQIKEELATPAKLKADEARAAKRAEAAKQKAESAETRAAETAANRKAKADAKAKAKAEADAAREVLRIANEEQNRVLDLRKKAESARASHQKRLDAINERIREYEDAIANETRLEPKAKRATTDPEIVKARADRDKARAEYQNMLDDLDRMPLEKAVSWITGMKLLNPMSRVKDLLANASVIVDQLGPTGMFQQAVSGGKYRSPLLNPTKAMRVIDRAKRDPIWRTWLAEGKFGDRGLGGKVAALTDVPAKMFIYHSTLDDLARLEWQRIGKSVKDPAWEDFAERFAMNPPEDAQAIAIAEAISDTFNADTFVKKGQDSVNQRLRAQYRKGDPTQRAMANVGGFALGNITRFANTLMNVALDRTARAIPFAGEAAALGRLGIEKRGGRVPDVAVQRQISRLFAKGAVGTASYYAGYHFLSNFIAPSGEVRMDESGGQPYWKWTSDIAATVEELGGGASPFLLGAMMRAIDDAPVRPKGGKRDEFSNHLAESEKKALKMGILTGVLTNQPITGQLETLAALSQARPGQFETAVGRGVASWFSMYPITFLAEQYDKLSSGAGITGDIPQRDSAPPDASSMDRLIAPVQRVTPGWRNQLPIRKEKTVYKP